MIVLLTAAAAGLTGLLPGSLTAELDGPGTNELVLRVDRLDQAEQVRFAGSEATAMLFDPAATALLDTAGQARAGAREAVRAVLFTGDGPAGPLRTPPSTATLFDASTWAEAGARQQDGAVAEPDERRTSGPALALGALLAAAVTWSVVLHAREGDR